MNRLYKYILFLLCTLCFPSLLSAEPDIYTRTRVTNRQQPYNYEQQNGQTQFIPTEQKTPPPAGSLMPDAGNTYVGGTRSQENKEFKPWEYEKNDDKLVRELQESIDESFIQGRMRANPLSPDRIKALQRDSLEVEEASRLPSPEKGISRFKNLSVEPGAEIPDVLLFPGNTTTLRFMDNSGAPWPVLSYVVGNSQGFTVQQAGAGTDQASNILIVTPLKTFADTSLAVTLAPDVPIVLMLHASVKNTKPDYLVTFRANAPGPNAFQSAVRKDKNAFVSDVMLSFLDGVPPKGSVRLKADGSIRAWKLNNKCYVRTGRTLIWPAYTSIVRSGANGIRVYELPAVSSIVLDKHGSPERIRLTPGQEVEEKAHIVSE